MRNALRFATFFGALTVVLVLAPQLRAAGPELTGKAFDVKVSNGTVDVTFALALSEGSSYPVTITAICCSTEEILFEGNLGEGLYHLSAPLKKISGRGDLKVVLKTKVLNRTNKGADSFLVYQKWQGSM